MAWSFSLPASFDSVIKKKRNKLTGISAQLYTGFKIIFPSVSLFLSLSEPLVYSLSHINTQKTRLC